MNAHERSFPARCDGDIWAGNGSEGDGGGRVAVAGMMAAAATAKHGGRVGLESAKCRTLDGGVHRTGGPGDCGSGDLVEGRVAGGGQRGRVGWAAEVPGEIYGPRSCL